MTIDRSVLAAPGHGVGDMAIRGLAAYGGDVDAFRAASPLPRDAQILFDNALLRVGRNRLTLVSDMIDAGMTYSLPNWLGVPLLSWKTINEGGNIRRTMEPKSRGERFVLDMGERFLPIYCTWGDFSFGVRTIEAARRGGYALETTHAEMINRRINEGIEDQALNGASVMGGATLQVTDENGTHTAPGFLTNPANTFTYTGNEPWDNAGHSGEEIIGDIMGGVELLQADRMYGPYRLYVPPSYWNKITSVDYKSATSGNILERIRANGIEVRSADFLPANKTLLIQMTSDVADVVIGQQPTMFNWSDENGWEQFFVVMACIVVRVKQTYTSQQGWAVGYTT